MRDSNGSLDEEEGGVFRHEMNENVAYQEAQVASKVIEIIQSGKLEPLGLQTGKSVEIKGSHIMVNNHVEHRYRVWFWHGHHLFYHEGGKYTPEFIYGNYFEPLMEEEEIIRSLGLNLATQKVEKKAKGKDKSKHGK